jgi:hypothetical protein
MKLKKSLLMTVAIWPIVTAASSVILLPSCGDDGAAEEAGEEIDEAVDDVKDKIDD